MEKPDISRELQSDIGRQIRALRLVRNQAQSELARQAGVALGALKSLEAGSGATLHTLVSVAQALGRSEWLQNLQAGAEPMARTPARLRAGRTRHGPLE